MSYQHYSGAGGFPPTFQAGPPPPQRKPAVAGLITGSTVTAGVLAVFGVVWHGVAVVSGALRLARPTSIDSVALVFNLALVVLLLVGAVLLFARKAAGRVLVVVGCALAIAMCVLAGFLVDLGEANLVDANPIKNVPLMVLILPAVATLALVLVPSTVDRLRQPLRQQSGYQSHPQQNPRPPGW